MQSRGGVTEYSWVSSGHWVWWCCGVVAALCRVLAVSYRFFVRRPNISESITV